MSSFASSDSAHHVTLEQTGLWLTKGWQDFQRAPGLSLLFGGLYPILGLGLAMILQWLDLGSLLLLAISAFMLIGPLAAICLYEIARRLERGEPLSIPQIFATVRQRSTAVGDLGLVLMMILLSWFLIGFVMFALFFTGTPPTLSAFVMDVLFNPASIPFMLASTVVGGMLATIVFTISMFAMPMLLDKDVTAAEAITFSVKAVWINRLNMIGWAGTVAIVTFLGMALAFIGLMVTFPVIAYASWHAYRDVAG